MCISQTIFFGFISSLFAVIFLTIISKFKTYYILSKLNSNKYNAYEIDGTLISGYKYKVTFGLINIITPNNKLTINQISNKFGNWSCFATINENNIFIASGLYIYDNNGPYSGTWGLQNIYINIKDKIIHIQSLSKEKPGTRDFLLKQQIT